MAVRPPKAFEDFVADLLGPPPGRRGGDPSLSWWPCPAHPDANPSFGVVPGEDHGYCFGCGFRPDAIDLVRHLNPGMGFPAAKAVVEGTSFAPPAPRRPPAPATERTDDRPPGWGSFALGLVEDAEHALWSDRGAEARAYLLGRRLTEETIRTARLGVILDDRWVRGVFPDGLIWIPAGISIPWFAGGGVVMVNVRRPDGSEPKYRTVRGSRRGRPYPSASVVRPGAPLILVEGEFEALLLNQEVGDLAPAVTFGSASDRPKGGGLGPILAASPWYVATDNDPAGETSAEAWLAASGRCRRVRPPGASKDWTEYAQAGAGLRRWWGERLGGIESPALFTWGELARLRWGLSLAHDLPGLDVGRGRDSARS